MTTKEFVDWVQTKYALKNQTAATKKAAEFLGCSPENIRYRIRNNKNFSTSEMDRLVKNTSERTQKIMPAKEEVREEHMAAYREFAEYISNHYQLGKKSHLIKKMMAMLGVAYGTVVSWERGKNAPKHETVIKMQEIIAGRSENLPSYFDEDEMGGKDFFTWVKTRYNLFSKAEIVRKTSQLTKLTDTTIWNWIYEKSEPHPHMRVLLKLITITHK